MERNEFKGGGSGHPRRHNGVLFALTLCNHIQQDPARIIRIRAGNVPATLAPLDRSLIKHVQHQILRAIRNDNYYCFVLPLMPPILLFFVFFNWLGLKLHRHNTA
ncbi:hypothetical protein BC830DRAFT_1058540 [Chytriomyces sp. MP71]|nr:hypothetical protein BC830DRAFT_1058540 [Chytriomyces sp. MP71]